MYVFKSNIHWQTAKLSCWQRKKSTAAANIYWQSHDDERNCFLIKFWAHPSASMYQHCIKISSHRRIAAQNDVKGCTRKEIRFSIKSKTPSPHALNGKFIGSYPAKIFCTVVSNVPLYIWCTIDVKFGCFSAFHFTTLCCLMYIWSNATVFLYARHGTWFFGKTRPTAATTHILVACTRNRTLCYEFTTIMAPIFQFQNSAWTMKNWIV